MGRNHPTPAQHQAAGAIIARLTKAQIAFSFLYSKHLFRLLNIYQGNGEHKKGGGAVVAALSVERKVAGSNPCLRHFFTFYHFNSIAHPIKLGNASE